MKDNSKEHLKDLIDMLEIQINTANEAIKETKKTKNKIQKLFSKVISRQ